MARQNLGLRLGLNARGIYEVRWTEAGRSLRASTRTADLSEAQQVLAEALQERKRIAEASQRETCTVAHVLDLYLREHVRKRCMAPKPIELVVPLLADHFGRLLPADIKPGDVEDYISRRAPGGDLGLGAQPHSVRRDLGVLVAALNHAVRTRRITRADVPHIAMPPAAEPRPAVLTPAQARALIDVALKGSPNSSEWRLGRGRLPRLYRFIALALNTGARRDAIENLTWDRVDFAAGTIDYREPGRRATRKRRVVVAIGPALLGILKRAHRERVTDYVLDTPSDCLAAFKRAARLAGVPDVTPHALRHTFATLALDAGESMWTVANALGDTVATVERTYAKRRPATTISAVAAVGAALAS